MSEEGAKAVSWKRGKAIMYLMYFRGQSSMKTVNVKRWCDQ